MKNYWKLRSNKKSAFTFLSIIWAIQFSFAQDASYMLPIRPGNQNYLSGTMGELRTNHFHGGIDIKTGGVEGLPVHAAESGYVSRIKVSGTGYGNVLYLAHPDKGTTTVYGHLQKFEESIALYVLENHYIRKRFEIEIFPAKDEFKVEKGDIIGYSGNSGSSGGPHLHFEIRDAYQRPVNPLKYQFSEIKDNMAPTIQKIAIKSLNIDSRINGQFGRFEYTPFRAGNQYKIDKKIEAYGAIGIQIMAYDRLNGASNRNGVPDLKLKFDQKSILKITIDKVPFNKNRNILVYKDYQAKQKRNQTFQKLYIDDGNNLDIYDDSFGTGRIVIRDTLIHDVEIQLKDAYGNMSTLSFEIKGNNPPKGTSYHTNYFKPYQHKVLDNTLVLMTGNEQDKDKKAHIYANRMVYALSPEYSVNNYHVLLWDLRKGLPDSIHIGNNSIAPQIEMAIPSRAAFHYYRPHMNLAFGKNTLFDTLYLRTDYLSELQDEREYFEISENIFPINQSLLVTLKPKSTYPKPEKTSVYYTNDFKHFSYFRSQWKGNNIEFKTRDFGKFVLLTDSIPPTIRIVEQNQSRFRCYIKDGLSGIKDFNLHIDGKWVLLNMIPSVTIAGQKN